jgi:hypothetical protein
MPEPPHPPVRQTLLQMLEGRTDASLEVLTTSRILFDLDLLLHAYLAAQTGWKVAAQELQACARLVRLAEKHEDLAVAQALREDGDYLRSAVPGYEARAQACFTEWYRLWRELEFRSKLAIKPGEDMAAVRRLMLIWRLVCSLISVLQ